MIDLRQGDCLDPSTGMASLADQSVDVLVSDPPWDGHAHAAKGALLRPRTRKTGNAALPFPPLDDDAIERLALEFARLTRRWVIVFVGERQVGTWVVALERAGLRFVRLGAARRISPCPRFDGTAPGVGFDPIVICHNPRTAMTWSGGGRAGIWDAPPTRFDPGGQVHPTQKSLALMRQLVEDFSDAGETICDPFAGSGTTAVAAKMLGRNFVGWELDQKYHACALKRLDDTREQRTLPFGATAHG